jgi:RHS repeat-associated protein
VTIKFTPSPIIQLNEYYPFGLSFNSSTRESAVSNEIKFQGQEHQDELGLNWDSFKWRNHQPEIGRFFNIDPISEKYYYNSPYAFSENHVTVHVELEGLEKVNVNEGVQKQVDKIFEKPAPPPVKIGNEGADGVGSLTVSVGLQGGFSYKVLGKNASFFVNFGSIDIINIKNGIMDFKTSPDVNVKEGVDLGIGPVGFSKEIQTERGGNEKGQFEIKTTSKTTVNLFNVDASSNTVERLVNPESNNTSKTTLSNSSIGVSQSAKTGYFVVISGSLFASYTSGRSAGGVIQINPKLLQQDATNLIDPRIQMLQMTTKK